MQEEWNQEENIEAMRKQYRGVIVRKKNREAEKSGERKKIEIEVKNEEDKLKKEIGKEDGTKTGIVERQKYKEGTMA